MNTVSVAAMDDIPRLIPLINSAYRGDEARKGWTHEADLIEGNKRTDQESLAHLLRQPQAVILKCESGSSLVGCVFLEKNADKLYLGMLSVSPELQGQGVGRQLLSAAEAYARDNHCTYIEMTVISVREELIAWYHRNGYQLTGSTQPFPMDGRFGMPRQEIHFVVLRKDLL